MRHIIDYPLLVFALSFIVMWLSAWIGSSFLRKRFKLDESLIQDFSFILPASLTLLGLIVGFSFSMAMGRYDQRKNYEESEANAIGTEYLRIDLLPAGDAERVRELLRTYLDQRILFYSTYDEKEVQQVNVRVAQLQADLWHAILPVTNSRPTPNTALVITGMNDVLNSQGYTQSAWWYRIPDAAWELMIAIAIACNLLMGYGARGGRSGSRLLLILPALISIAFLLIADIDSPRHGLIHLKAPNLVSLAESLRPH